MKNYDIGFGMENLFIRTKASSEEIEEILRPLEQEQTANQFYEVALDKLSKKYDYELLEGKEIIQLIETRNYKCLFFNW
jgi:rubrerythrin